MQLLKSIITIILSLLNLFAVAQLKGKSIKPVAANWTVYNRQVDYHGEVIHLDAQRKDGVLWINDTDFKNGIIELEIKGKDVQGESFVGIAFHGSNDSTFHGIYFRPFNFKSPERGNHAVQYINMPKYDWRYLRETFPGKYENNIHPVPDPNDWFHARIVIQYPSIKVYVNDASNPTLEVDQLDNKQNGKIGLWVGNESEGWFKNISVKKTG